MAFDHEDTDTLYENLILPVLKSSGVIPVIINRREDNSDINNQIIEQLSTCDFCIADLTYARPSVYFEAGYAQRNVEVIYTVRLDHLKKDQPDNLQVHFDLKMKPLIKWSNSIDKVFSEKLQRRLNQTVLKKWNLTQKVKEKDQKNIEDFKHMALNERLIAIRKTGLHILNKLGYSSWKLITGESFSHSQSQLSYEKMHEHSWGFSSFRSK